MAAEPRAVAERLEEVVPGVWHWSVDDERIGSYGASHAVAGERGVVLVDPYRLAPAAAAALGDVEAIVLTSGSHQRNAWSLREELGVPLHLPRQSQDVPQEPDGRYREGDVLPGGLRAFFTPGAGTTQHALLRDRVLFTADLFSAPPGGGLSLVPDRFLHDPAQARESARRLLELDFDVLCSAHAAPVTSDPKGAIRAALAHAG